MSALTEAGVGGGRVVPLLWLTLRLALAAFFAYLAVKNLSGDERMARDFARFGYPDWFRVAVAIAQVVGAVLLLLPQTRLVGCAVLAVVLLGAVASHVRHDPLPTALSAVVFLGLVGLVAYEHWRAE